jgi:hypothetical protein
MLEIELDGASHDFMGAKDRDFKRQKRIEVLKLFFYDSRMKTVK